MHLAGSGVHDIIGRHVFTQEQSLLTFQSDSFVVSGGQVGSDGLLPEQEPQLQVLLLQLRDCQQLGQDCSGGGKLHSQVALFTPHAPQFVGAELHEQVELFSPHAPQGGAELQVPLLQPQAPHVFVPVAD